MKDKATAKNDVQVIMEEYIGNRKAAKVAERISAVMQEETKHIHKGEVFYVHKDEEGALVLTMESTVKSQVESILNSYLEKDEVQECLELLIGKQSLSETKVTVKTTVSVETKEFETIKVEGSDSKIYAKLMKHHPANNEEKQFISRMEEAVHSSVTSFEVPVCDPSIDDNGKLQFVPGFKPAVGYSYNELEKLAKENGLRLGNKLEYFLFLGTLINSLIVEGWTEADAWNAVCTDSKELGHYWDSANAKHAFELTGSRKVAGKCDLANAYKILAKDEKAGGFWLAGGNYNSNGFSDPLADLNLYGHYDFRDYNSVGWFVL